MNKKISNLNPFLLSGYVSPEYFCDRQAETEKIISALENGRNITLISPRRMGKTGLIRHVFSLLSKRDDCACYYVDLYQTDSLASLVNKLGNAVLGTLDSTESRIVRQVGMFFKSLRPVVSIDPMTGDPSFTIDLRPELAERSLEEIFAYMEQSGKRCYIAFDEFHTVADYADRNVEALLRSHIQHLTKVGFIFSGSQRHVFENMFVSVSRPFYQSTQMMQLDCIDVKAYYSFASEKLEANGQILTEDDFEYLYYKLFGHTWYIQMTMNRLYESGIKLLTRNDIDSLLEQVVQENEATYQTFVKLITNFQEKVMRAVAIEGNARELLGQAFIRRHQLSSPSSVRSAMNALIDKELLLDVGDSVQVYDRFFALWLRIGR